MRFFLALIAMLTLAACGSGGSDLVEDSYTYELLATGIIAPATLGIGTTTSNVVWPNLQVTVNNMRISSDGTATPTDNSSTQILNVFQCSNNVCDGHQTAYDEVRLTTTAPITLSETNVNLLDGGVPSIYVDVTATAGQTATLSLLKGGKVLATHVFTVVISTTFTKVDSSGNLLPDSAVGWSCVLDKRTGLYWEVKADDGGLRDKDWVYTSYETTGTNAGGVCDQSKTCNQSYFRDAVNAASLCGYKDWRVAQVTELEGLLDGSQSQPPYIDAKYFPFTVAATYWATNEFVSAVNQNIWWVDFASMHSASTPFRDLKFHVRLVRP